MVASVVVTYFWAVPYVAGESLAVVALAGLDGGSGADRRDGRLGAWGRLPVLSAAGWFEIDLDADWRGGHSGDMDRGRVVSPVFVGRTAGLHHVEGVLAEAALGNPAVVLVAGEAGVGKSRFVAEVLARQAPRAVCVLAGECSGFAPGSQPYAPIAAALRRLLRSGEQEADLLNEAREAVGLLLPELAAAGQAAGDSGLASLDQGRMFAQLETVLDKLSASAPLVLVIEDLHWADRSSLEFLAYLCHGLHRQRLAVLCTYRDDELPAVPALGAWLADLRRGAWLTEVSLPRFTMAELAEQVAAILGGAADPDLVAALHERSYGNPYYTELLLSAISPGTPGGAGASAALPTALREALLTRLAGITAGTRELLAIIAAAGHPVAHAAVAAACARLGIGAESLLAGLREAVDRHLLVAVADLGGYAFRHALLAEATYDQLLPGERKRLHDVWAGVLEDQVTGGEKTSPAAAAEVAVHYHKASHPEAAFGWDLRAAEAAKQVGGVAEAAGCYRRMLAAWDDVADAGQQAGFDRVELLIRLARAEELAGDISSVRTHLQDAVALVDPATEPLRAALLQVRLCWALHISGQPATAVSLAAAAVKLVPESPPSLARVGVLANLGGLEYILGRGDRAAATAAAAAAAADQVLDPRAAAWVAQLRSRVAWLTGHPDAVALARRALRLGRQAGARGQALNTFHGLAVTLDAAGNDRGVLQACYGGYQYSRRVGGANYGAWLLCRACLTLIACGRTADAAEALHAAQRVRLSGIFEVYAQLAVAGLATLSGDFEAGRTAIERCRRVAPDPLPWAWRYCAAAAELELWAGDPERAYAAAAEGLAAVARTDYRRHAGTLAWMALRATADRGELARARQDTAASSQACAEASQLRRTWSTAGWLTAEPPDRARALHALLDAEHARAADHSDPQQWARATRYSHACHRPHQAAYAAWRQAEALLVQHAPRHAAACCLRSSYSVALDTGAIPLQHEVETLARYARIELHGSPPSQDAHSVPLALQALTGREREVLNQLASGLTNRQIAERLYISPRTAAVHVSSVLHKLGVPDRIQAAHLARKLQDQNSRGSATSPEPGT